jgi:hypothetical protein
LTLWKLGLIEHDPAAYTIGSLATKICCQSEVAERISELICEEDAVQDDYAVSAVAADKYAYLGNCDEMDIILSNGVQQGWHFADEDQKYPWDYMNMIYCLEAGKQFSVGTGNSGDADVPLDGTVTNDSTIGERCWLLVQTERGAAHGHCTGYPVWLSYKTMGCGVGAESGRTTHRE